MPTETTTKQKAVGPAVSTIHLSDLSVISGTFCVPSLAAGLSQRCFQHV